MGKIVLITGVSGSGKTTIQDELKERGWYKPINYTTRQPRNNKELDDYVFCNTSQFMKKMNNLDFLETTTYGGNLYGIPKFDMTDKKFAIIVDPIGRAQLMKSFAESGTKYHTIYLDIDKETQLQRLEDRGDSINEIKKRLLDRKWFEPTRRSVVIDGTNNIKTIVDYINNL